MLLILITLLAGLYPAWVLSGFQPADTLKRIFKAGKGAIYFRKGLVITQFTVSVAMIVATWVMASQLRYMQHKSLGYDREQVLVARFEGKIPEEKKTLFRQKIQSMRFVKAASFSSHLPGSAIGENKLVPDFLPPGTDLGIQFMFADESHLEALGIELAEGRGFTKGNALGTTEFYINEAAARRFQWKEGAGRKLAYYTYQYTPEGGYREIPAEGEVVGVLRDYHTQSLRTAIEPLLIVRYNEPLGNLAIKIQEEHVEEAIKTLSGTWADIFPGVPFEYHFLDDTYNANYQTEVRSGRVVALFAAFAILISCLGVFGLSAFAAEQRTKEIGIRKVMGASALSIVALLSKDLTGLIVAASLIACPLAWWAMNQWLADFAYRIDIPWWAFALAGGVALLLAFATISFQSIRAAIANPVNSLRSE
ncbi:MAG: FtsX-like permease family protein [Bacteroidetes bacterium]|nr:MAG: FtsX-like permease family protein [Bacteroidota bacterium]